MFDLEKAISTWRHQYIHNRVFDSRDIDELERHVRDQVDHLVDKGKLSKAHFEPR